MPKAIDFSDINIFCKKCGQRIPVKITRDITRKKFCSRSCRTSWNYENNDNMGMIGKNHTEEFKKKLSVIRKNQNLYGKNHSCWKGGRRINRDGYIIRWVSPNKVGLEHRLIAEELLGRKLRFNEVVHHIDGNKSNNENNNLVIMERSEHQRLHWKKGDYVTTKSSR